MASTNANNDGGGMPDPRHVYAEVARLVLALAPGASDCCIQYAMPGGGRGRLPVFLPSDAEVAASTEDLEERVVELFRKQGPGHRLKGAQVFNLVGSPDSFSALRKVLAELTRRKWLDNDVRAGGYDHGPKFPAA